MSKISIQAEEKPLMRCLIVDDEIYAIEGVADYLGEIGGFEIVASCCSAMEAIEVLKTQKIDLMFLDINMPRLTGLEFLELLERPPLTILTTAYAEFALDGFRLNVVDYLLKPYSLQRFFTAVSKAQELYQSKLLLEKDDRTKVVTMYIRQGTSYQRIEWEEILFVEGMQNYLKLYFADKEYIIHQTMSSLEDMLPKDSFFRIHNSYLVHVKHIDSVSSGRVMVKGKELPLSKYRREDFFNSVVYKNLISK